MKTYALYCISLSVILFITGSILEPIPLYSQGGASSIPRTVISVGAVTQTGIYTIRETIGQPVTSIASQPSFEGRFGFWYTLGKTSTSVPEDYVSMPETVVMSIFPNPFLSEATIRISIQKPSRLRISVYSVTGVLASLLFDRIQGMPESTYSWTNGQNTRIISPGIYYVVADA